FGRPGEIGDPPAWRSTMSSPRTQLLAPLAALTVLVGIGVGWAHAGSTLSSCLAECKRSHLSVTNRATCRLDCEVDAASDPEVIQAQTASLRPPVPRPASRPVKPPAPAPVASSARPGDPGCKAACDADAALSADDRATCKLECDLVPDPMPTGTPPPMRPPSAAALASARTGTAPTTTTPGAAVARTAADRPGFLARCHATCKPGRGEREATDYESCKLDCNNMASVLDVASVWVPEAWDGRPAVAAPPVVPVEPGPVVTRPAPPRRAAPAPARATCGPTLEKCRASCVTSETKCAQKCSRKHIQETDRETCKLGCGTDQEVCQGDCLSATATCVNDSNPR
ncbi:MAG TPA: hypothetical protein VGB85_33250, partial [Nannocystis sp.]